MKINWDNLNGRKFGKLTIESVTTTKKGKKSCECICSCGKKITVPHSKLKNSSVRSCGC